MARSPAGTDLRGRAITKRLIALVLLAASLGASACGPGSADARRRRASRPTPPPGGVLVVFGRDIVKAEVADDPDERSRGLMFRRQLGRNAGMLFVFEAPSTGGFWMKNTTIPLSIAYLRSTGTDSYEVLEILDMVPCRADPCPSYPPKEAYDAALEVNRGWYADHGVRVGDTATVRR